MDLLYQHYGKEERPFIDQVLGWINQVDNKYTPYLSGFLTPREKMIVEQLVNRYDHLNVDFQGGYPNCERTRALIMPEYYEQMGNEFNLTLFNINFPLKFANISHGKILGTLISTGIHRDRIGDIISDGQYWHVIVDQAIRAFLQTNVRKIGNVGVSLEVIDFDEILSSNEEWETKTIIVSSLRLDNVISSIYNISRQRAKDAIAAGLVKMNFVEMDRADTVVKENDIVSLRKYGRAWIHSIDGKTKKDNIRLNVSVLKR